MQRAKAGAIGALVLITLDLIFDFLTYPLFAAHGFKFLSIAQPLYYFVTTTIISFGIGMAFAILYLIVRTHIPYDGIEKGIVYGLFIWAMVECVKAAKIIAYTRLPIIYSVIWLFEGLITYTIYGGVMYMLLEPYAHLWPHPEVLKTAVPRKTEEKEKKGGKKSYYCKECGRNHYTDSKIGKKHKKYAK